MFLQSSEFERCAQSEVTSFARFRHSNILPLLDSVSLLESSSGNKSKVMYMLFPMMPRGSLRDVLNARIHGTSSDPLPPLHLILADFISIAEALNVLHTFQPAYVHQDLKPENVLVGADGTPYLIDFGSVRLADVPIRDRSKALKVAEEAATVSAYTHTHTHARTHTHTH
jgi:serine/threonine kinase 16